MRRPVSAVVVNVTAPMVVKPPIIVIQNKKRQKGAILKWCPLKKMIKFVKNFLKCNLFFLILMGVSVVSIILSVRYFYGHVDLALIVQHTQLIKTIDLGVYWFPIFSVGIITFFSSICIYKRKSIGIPLLLIVLGYLIIPEINFYSANEHKSLYHQFYTIPKIIPPQKPKNIIWISLESTEKLWTYSDVTKGENVIPKLTELQKEGTVIRGWQNAIGMEPTFPSYVSTNCGIPRNTSVIGRDFRFPQTTGSYPLAICMTDILRKHGYDTTFIMGGHIQDERMDLFTDAHPYTTVMSREKFLSQGYSTKKQVITKSNDITPDAIVLDYAKNKIIDLTKTNKPFFISIVTANTHGPGYTYIEPGCERKYNDVRDCFKCMDQKVVEFVRWVQNQPFYKDTVIFLIGDHPAWRLSLKHMKWLDFNRVKAHDPAETYNLVLDGAAKEPRIIDKIFTQVDWAPTMLESAGFKLKQRRLGLGVSLWSDEPTLVEKFGSVRNFSEELYKSEPTFNKFFYGKNNADW